MYLISATIIVLPKTSTVQHGAWRTSKGLDCKRPASTENMLLELLKFNIFAPNNLAIITFVTFMRGTKNLHLLHTKLSRNNYFLTSRRATALSIRYPKITIHSFTPFWKKL